LRKDIQFSTQGTLGQCFAEAVHITRKGGGLEKIAGVRHPKIESYLKSLRPDSRYQYVLMTPMGAFEYWGMNVNGDIFPVLSLSYDMFEHGNALRVAKALEDRWLAPFGKKIPPGNYTTFGYRTFEGAERYRHHVNKDPRLSYGQVVLSVWNPLMHRVEVVVRHDREKAKAVGAEDILEDLDEGKSRQISMGCKVPFDVCTVCGHISRTPGDYCDHLRLQMGSILDDGTIVGAVNFFPRFFEISDVFIPAAKESGVLMKVASDPSLSYFVPSSFFAGKKLPTGAVPVEMDRGTILEKMASSSKAAASDKKADIDKELLPNTGGNSFDEATKHEPDLPSSVLRGGDLSKLLTTLAMMGIVTKPREFQYAMLHRMGKGDQAEKLQSEGRCFTPCSPTGHTAFSEDDFSPGLAEALSHLIRSRSGFSPHVGGRVRVVVIKTAAELGEEDDELLQKVANAYSRYRGAFGQLAPVLNLVVEQNPEYYQEHFFGELLTDEMAKIAVTDRDVLSGRLSSLYLYNAYQPSCVELPSGWCSQVSPTSSAAALLQ